MVQILIIDDDPIIQLVLKRTLQEQGYDVVLAASGEDGIVKAQQICPALIICDWLMAGMDGLEVCRQIKANPDLSTTFFILLTARTAVEDRVKGLDTGADDFLPKPIEVNELKARVRSGLRLYQSAQELQKLARDLQIQKQVLEAELAEAAEYVRSLLPVPLTGAVTTHARFLPSSQLGGDCFDYFWLDPDYLVIYLLDVSGHGLGSALPSVSVHNLLRSQSLQGVNFYQPSDVLRSLNEVFQMGTQNERYFTIWYGVYNQQRRHLVYASAGHPPAVLISTTSENTPQTKQLKPRGVPIGMLPDSKYISEHCDIPKSSTLYVFSDGIYDIKPLKGNAWSLDDFINLLSRCNSSETCDLDEILQQVQRLQGMEIFEDDCSLLQIKFS